VKKHWLTLILSVAIGVAIWVTPIPEGLDIRAWRVLAVFLFTIFAIITQSLPMGLIAIISLTTLIVTHTLTFQEAFSGFENPVVWLVVAAFFIARGFVKSGLGLRIAYKLMMLLGKSSIGLAYGVVITDLIMAPAIPSLTARTGGVLFPILTSLSKAFGSEGNSHPRRIGAYLMQTAFQGSVVTSAMFLTSMAGNPLIAELVKPLGINLTWTGWITASIVPGLISLFLIPLLLYRFYPPEIKQTPEAAEYAKKMLAELGPVSRNEWIMAGVFCFLIFLWALGPMFHLGAATTALIGLCIILLTNVLSWEDALKEKSAWDTMIWFSTLVMMAGFLNQFGLTGWFSQMIVGSIQGYSWVVGFGVLVLIYFYSHYFYASNVAHIGSMYLPFLVVSIAFGAPPMLAALVLAFFSNLFGNLTHYGCGPAPILYAAGFVSIGQWWRLGFIFSVINIIIWIGVGSVWWKFLGIY